MRGRDWPGGPPVTTSLSPSDEGKQRVKTVLTTMFLIVLAGLTAANVAARVALDHSSIRVPVTGRD